MINVDELDKSRARDLGIHVCGWCMWLVAFVAFVAVWLGLAQIKRRSIIVAAWQ
jgi:hypothetical protein